MSAGFLELVESYDQATADARRMYDGEGSNITHISKGRRLDESKVLKTAELLSDVMRGRRPAWILREVITTSDFPLYFGTVIDRAMLGVYQQWPTSYRQYVRTKTVNDFRTVNLFAIDGAEAVLSAVPERTEYPMVQLAETRYTLAVSKYGRSIGFSWEAMLMDDLDGLKDIPMRFGNASARTEEKAATNLFVDASGPHASFYTSGNKNIVNTTNGASATNPPLSISALQDAMTVLSKQVDADGEPILIDSYVLVVPPALEVTAQNILHGTELWLNAAGGATNQQLHTLNWMRSKVQLAVNPYIPVIASSANGATTWFLFADSGVGRPALVIGFLRGHETPELFMKTPNQSRIGGGAIATDGDFETDTTLYKVRHVLGTARVDPKMTVASNGSGS